MNPYETLGIPPDASDEDVKKAYREQAKKYHPDNYVNNPLADLAAEKMKAVNTAYEQIVSSRQGGSTASVDPSARAHSGESYAAIRNCISVGNYDLAEKLLQAADLRDAEWHFLMGCVAYQKGWMSDASENFSMACRMAPDNMEYRAAYDRMHQRRTVYRGQSDTAFGGGPCDMCATLCCMDSCCECMGGDLCQCC